MWLNAFGRVGESLGLEIQLHAYQQTGCASQKTAQPCPSPLYTVFCVAGVGWQFMCARPMLNAAMTHGHSRELSPRAVAVALQAARVDSLQTCSIVDPLPFVPEAERDVVSNPAGLLPPNSSATFDGVGRFTAGERIDDPTRSCWGFVANMRHLASQLRRRAQIGKVKCGGRRCFQRRFSSSPKATSFEFTVSLECP